MRVWIDTDIGDDPDDTIALWCATRMRDAEVAGVSTVDGDVEARAALVRSLLPDVEVTAGAPRPEQVAPVDVLVGIGPWTNIATLADALALPRRVVLMGGAIGRVHHHHEWIEIEHNVGRDPQSAARLIGTVGNLIIVPLDATARLRVSERDEEFLVEHIPGLGGQIAAWRERHGDDRPLVLHDPATLFVGLGERIARAESRRLAIDPDGNMRASVSGPVQEVVAHIDVHATRARVRALSSRG